jgi:uncharacterized RDD family membrane protein YckC
MGRFLLSDAEDHDLSEQIFSASLESKPEPTTPQAKAKFLVDRGIHEQHSVLSGLQPVASPVSDFGSQEPEADSSKSQKENSSSEGATAMFSQSDTTSPANSDESWRTEVAARLDRYRSRRKPRAPRYPSLRLTFEAPEPQWPEVAAAASLSSAPQVMSSTLATAAALAPIVGQTTPLEETEPADFLSTPAPEVRQENTPEPAGKIIEFPRLWSPPPRGDELAEPVMTHPRILDVPEIAPPPPALGGILIETEKLKDEEKRPGIDIPLQSAPIEKRLMATAIDGMLVLAASSLFGYIVFRLSHPVLPTVQVAGLFAGIAAILWAAYQYVFLVHTGTTPGLLCMKLRLCQFDGKSVHQSLRRWRVLVSFLSAASLGMGYAWHFLDEDALCWHDRMTHTYIGPVESIAAP